MRPLPSMTQASSGTTASLLTALMTPREMMTVAFSTRGPETGTTVTPRMAKYSGSPPCAAAGADPSKAAHPTATTPSANLKLRNEERIRHSLDLDSAEDAIHPPMLRRRTRLVGSYGRVKEIAVVKIGAGIVLRAA